MNKIQFIESIITFIFGLTMTLTSIFTPPLDVAILLLSIVITIIGFVFFFIHLHEYKHKK